MSEGDDFRSFIKGEISVNELFDRTEKQAFHFCQGCGRKIDPALLKKVVHKGGEKMLVCHECWGYYGGD